MLRVLVYLLFFASGISGLVYEILWMRKLTLIFGCTVYATSAVLTSFMGGLALGSFFFGRWADRWKNPLRLYGALEIAIGASTALAMTFLLPVMDSVYTAAFRLLGGDAAAPVVYASGPLVVAVRFVLALLILIIPTTLMGGTLPVISRYFVGRPGSLGLEVGKLYAVNTLGAMFGCFLCGFMLIRTLGETRTTALAVGLNLAVGAVILLLSRRAGAEAGKPVPAAAPAPGPGSGGGGRTPAPADPGEDSRSPSAAGLPPPPAGPAPRSAPGGVLPAGRVRAAFWAFGLAGFASLAYEVIWTRALINVIGSDVYCFTVILTTFLFGITLGSFVIARFADRIRRLFLVFGLAEVALGCLALATIPMMDVLPAVGRKVQGLFMEEGLAETPFATRTVSMFAVAFLIFLGPTILMGAVFPIVNRIYQKHVAAVGRNVGDVYSVNTLGTILGSAAAGLLILPLFGVAGSIAAVSVVNLGAGIFVSFLERGNGAVSLWRFAGVLAAGGAFAAVAASGMTSGVPGYFREPGVDLRIPYYKETPAATLYVKEYGGQDRNVWGYPVRKLVINHHPTAHNLFLDIVVHKMLAHVPVLLHENPKKGLVVGFGLGATSYSMLQHPGMLVDCVELLEEEIRTASWFERENHDIIGNNDRFRLIINDGRNHVLAADETYDVISVNAIDPRLSPALYTWNFYKLCRARMTGKGIMALWLPTYGISKDAYFSIYKSFQDVFPHSFVFFSNQSHFLLVGSPEPIRVDLSRFRERAAFPAVKKSLGEVCLDDPLVLLSTAILTPEGLRGMVRGAALNTDLDPTVEFDRETRANPVFNPDFFRAVLEHRADIVPYLDVGTGEEEKAAAEKVALYARRLGEWMEGEYEHFTRAPRKGMARMIGALDPEDGNLFLKVSLAVLNPAKMDAPYFRAFLDPFSRNIARVAEGKPGMVMIHHFLASAYARMDRMEDALEQSEAAVRQRPEDWFFGYTLGMRYRRLGRKEEARRCFERVRGLSEGGEWGSLGLARLSLDRGDGAGAAAILKAALDGAPGFARGRALLEKIEGASP